MCAGEKPIKHGPLLCEGPSTWWCVIPRSSHSCPYPNVRLWYHFPEEEQLFGSTNEDIPHCLIRLHMVSSLIKLNLAKRTAVVHWGSYSQSTHKRASPCSQSASQLQACSSTDPVSAAPTVSMASFGCKWQQHKRTKQEANSNSGSLGPGSLSSGMHNLPKSWLRRASGSLSGSCHCFSADTAPHHVHGHSWCWFLTFTTRDKCRSSSLVPSPKFQERALLGSSRLRSWALKPPCPQKVGHSGGEKKKSYYSVHINGEMPTAHS